MCAPGCGESARFVTNHHPWLKISPEKVRGPLDRVSWDAAGLWSAVQLYMADTGSDGSIRKRDLSVATGRRLSPSKCVALAVELVEEQLWEDCDERIRSTHWEQPDVAVWTDPVLRMVEARNKRLLRDSELCQRIKDRDRNLCRYCGARVNWADKKSARAGTYDHVDPDLKENVFVWIAVACKGCNGRKGHRTPEQAGMPLYKPGTTAEQVATRTRAAAASDARTDAHEHARAGPAPPSEPGPDLDRIQIGSESDLDHRPDLVARPRETGPIQIGSESPSSLGPGRTVAPQPRSPQNTPTPVAALEGLPQALVEMLHKEDLDVGVD